MFEQEQILQYLRLFVQPGQVTELRSFGGGAALAGWFEYDHLSTAAQAAAEMQRAASGVYFTPNPVDPALLSRRRNAVGPARECTTDADILRRRWLLIDVDPVRPTGTNATDAERAAAWGVLCSVQHALPGMSGEIVGSSGNGWHLCYPIDAPNDDETREKIRTALIGLQDRCGAPGAAVDAKTFNAARIWKLYGTAARKGVASADRPHRIAFLAGSPTAPIESVRQANTAALWALLETWKRQADAYQTLTAPTTTSDAAKRARAYLGRIPPAVSGQDGHGATYHAAMVLVEGFALSREEALPLLAEWNAGCLPPWTERELGHKIDSALKNARNCGHLLRPVAGPVAGAKSTVYTGPDTVPEPVVEEDDHDATAVDLQAISRTITWTWPQWIQRGTLTCLASEPGIGKTRFCMDLARRINLGLPWPGGTPATFPVGSKVLWVASDNQWAELGSLPTEFGFDPAAIVLNGRRSNPYAGTNLDSPDDLAELERRIQRVNPVLIFVDTVGNATERNQGRAEEAKMFFKPLAEIATRRDTSLLCITHLNRGGQVLGNRIVGAVRQVLMLEHPDVTQEHRRRLYVSKTNSKKPPALGVTMGGAGNTYDLDPPGGADDPRPTGRPSNLEADVAWLREMLAISARPVVDLRTDADAAGIGSSRLYKAKDALNVVETPVNNRKWWRLPGDDA